MPQRVLPLLPTNFARKAAGECIIVKGAALNICDLTASPVIVEMELGNLRVL